MCNIFVSLHVRYMIIDYLFCDINEIVLYDLKLGMVKKMVNDLPSRLGIVKDNVSQSRIIDKLAMTLCEKGRMKTLDWLRDISGMAFSSHNMVITLFKQVCAFNRLKFTKQMMPLVRNDLSFYVQYDILESVCDRRSIRVLLWIIDTFDNLYINLYKYGCKADSLLVIKKLLVIQYGDESTLPKSVLDDILESAAQLGSMRIIKWLFKTSNITKDQIIYIFKAACSYHRFKMMKWLIKKTNVLDILPDS